MKGVVMGTTAVDERLDKKRQIEALEAKGRVADSDERGGGSHGLRPLAAVRPSDRCGAADDEGACRDVSSP
jgi:hypothetical protein